MVMAYADAQKLPFLIVFNKVDVAVMSIDEALQKHDIIQYKNVKIRTIAACSITGEGLH